MIDIRIVENTAGEEMAIFDDIAGRDAKSIYDDVATLQANMTEVFDRITALEAMQSDSGWLDIPLADGIIAYNETLRPKYRKIGKQVFVRGVIKGITGPNVLLGTLPDGFRPAVQHYFVEGGSTVNHNGSAVGTFYNCQINADGTIRITTNSIGVYDASNYLRLSNSFSIE